MKCIEATASPYGHGIDRQQPTNTTTTKTKALGTKLRALAIFFDRRHEHV
jgi:hypothetical protein